MNLEEWMDASSRRSSEMARDRRGLCPAVDCGRCVVDDDDDEELVLWILDNG
jgi:hypothetical protein